MLVDVIDLLSYLGSGLTIAVMLFALMSFLYNKRIDLLAYKLILKKKPIPDNTIQEVIDEISRNDNMKIKTDLLKIVISIEIMIRKISLIKFDISEKMPTRKMISLLTSYNVFDEEWNKKFKIMWQIRNGVIHGENMTEDDINWGISLAVQLHQNLKQKMKQLDY